MSLVVAQQRFMALILDDDEALPSHWNARQGEGMAIYRNAYRTRLIDALREVYPRTERHVGEEAFARAAAHHLITRPPNSWTLDHAGEGFADTLADLFAQDPEVPVLGWLEGAMHRAFVAQDTAALTPLEFAAQTAAFTDEDWGRFSLCFLPGTAIRWTGHDIARLWQSLASDENAPGDLAAFAAPQGLLVWREGLRPVFRHTGENEAAMLVAMLHGDSYAAACALLADRLGDERAASEAGLLLGQWLRDGLIAAIKC